MYDDLWRLVRLVVGATGAIVFVVAGHAMRGIESISGDSIAEVFYQAMGLFAYGMAALTVLLAVPVPRPGSAMEADRSDGAGAAASSATCPECPAAVVPGYLGQHLRVAHGYSPERAAEAEQSAVD